MTRRASSPDTPSDLAIRNCLNQQPPRSFIMKAGAGSGKTTSLVKALQHLAEQKGPALKRAGQQVACVTYTNVAVAEIEEDVADTELFHVFTIHSFLWSLIQPFQSDICEWVATRIDGRIEEKQEHHDKPRTQQRTKERLIGEIMALELERELLSQVPKFEYGTGSDYSQGILGHDDILKLVPAVMAAQPLLPKLIAKRFPYIFVDESQDTNPPVVEALRQIAIDFPEICVGFFGDPMQKIYTTGAGDVAPVEGWEEITKEENFRCPISVLDVINAIRASGDGLKQTRGKHVEVEGALEPVIGSAQLFILPADEQRSERLKQVRNWAAERTEDPLWLSDEADGDVRLLVLVHRMAARRLGFQNLYAALHDRAPSSLSDGLDDGTAWPLRPFRDAILPIVMAARDNNNFEVIATLRSSSPKFQPGAVEPQGVPAMLQAMQTAVDELILLMEDNSAATIKQVLSHARDRGMASLDDRFDGLLVGEPEDDGRDGFENLVAFLNCRAAEFWGYRRYLEDESPFATQQGVKGAQFERVLVVLDDDEGSHSHFNYGKYFGYVPLSDRDEQRIEAGEESVIDRTRRLFYVCCSRAMQDLVVVLFAPDEDAARAAVGHVELFPEESIFGVAELDNGMVQHPA